MRLKKTLVAAASCCLLLGLATTVLADHKIDGTYELQPWSFSPFGGNSSSSKIWFQKQEDGSYTVVRQVVPEEGSPIINVGHGTMGSDQWIRAEFKESSGITDALDSIGSDEDGTSNLVGRGFYKVYESGRVFGVFVTESEGRSNYAYEYGSRGEDEPMPEIADSTGSDSTDPDGTDTADSTGTDDDGTDDDSTGADDDATDDSTDTDDDATDDSTGTDDDATDDSTGTDDDATDDSTEERVTLTAPASGTFLAGQVVAVEMQPADAELTIAGPAEQTDEGLKITGAGEITLSASKGEQSSEEVKLTAIVATVAEIEVLDGVKVSDAGAPHFSAQREGQSWELAVIRQAQPLKLRVKLTAEADLSQAAEVTVSASSGELAFEKSVSVGTSLTRGSTFTIESTGNLAAGVQINELDLSWSVGEQALEGNTPLVVCTTYGSPIKNISRDQTTPNTKRHFFYACRWAKGATQNIGNGLDSIGYNVDNYMTHYVHWKDLGDFEPLVPAYPRGSEAPLNYGDLRGWSRRNDDRGITSLYYPPLEPKKDYEQYTNYRNNFGWWVLDNPTHTGGRCNQQAALVAGILGTLGIKAEVLYLHRVSRGKDTGRPVRMYFYSNDNWPRQSATGGGPWNFHGVALATMADGTQHIYDGSFSSPSRPNADGSAGRKNGTKDWAQNPGGPFIHSWAPNTVYYDDWRGGRVPDSDNPWKNDDGSFNDFDGRGE